MNCPILSYCPEFHINVPPVTMEVPSEIIGWVQASVVLIAILVLTNIVDILKNWRPKK